MSSKGIVTINPKRARVALAVGVALGAMLMAEPALAFSDAGKTIVDKTNEAITVAKKVLVTAAVLALIIGLAPMLWGQVKVKWIISSLVACVLFGLTGEIVQAFSS